MKNSFLKTAVLFLAFSTSLSASAFELAAGLTPPARQRPLLNYSGFFHQKAEFPGGGQAETSFQNMGFSMPVYKTDSKSVGLSISGNEMAVRPTQGSLSRLYELKFGVSYTEVIDDKRLWSVMADYGSASDKLFANETVNTLGITGLYSKPRDETSSWLFLVNYSNNRPILNNIPLPGFAFFYFPSKEFRAVVGAPFASVNWQFADDFGLDFFTLVPWIIKTSVNYKLNEFAKAYVGIDFSQITYYLADRTERKERLFFDEKKLFLGFKSPLSKSVFADFEMGHAFDRAFFTAENYERNPSNPTEIGNAYYAKLSIRAMF